MTHGEDITHYVGDGCHPPHPFNSAARTGDPFAEEMTAKALALIGADMADSQAEEPDRRFCDCGHGHPWPCTCTQCQSEEPT